MFDIKDLDNQDIPSVSIKDRSRLPPIHAVYFVISSTGEFLYVGKTTNLFQRFKSHNRIKKFLVDSGTRIYWTEEKESKKLAELEKVFIQLLNPKINTHLQKPEGMGAVVYEIDYYGQSLGFLILLPIKNLPAGKLLTRTLVHCVLCGHVWLFLNNEPNYCAKCKRPDFHKFPKEFDIVRNECLICESLYNTILTRFGKVEQSKFRKRSKWSMHKMPDLSHFSMPVIWVARSENDLDTKIF